MTLNKLKWRNSPYFAFFYQIRLLCWPSTHRRKNPQK